jgi:hypothetical protein
LESIRENTFDRKGRGHTQCTPYFAVVFLESKNTLEVIDRLKIDITSLRDLIERITKWAVRGDSARIDWRGV